MRASLFNDPRVRALVYQAALVAAVLLTGWYFVSNTIQNLAARNIASGFAFLSREAGFEIGETGFFSYGAADTYLRALGIGLANTVRVAAIGIVLATAIGTLIGLARLSHNWLVARLATVYVEVMRNVPLLVQLFLWYAIIAENLPGPREAVQALPGVFLSNRGIVFPVIASWWPLQLEQPVLQGFNFSGGAVLTPEFAALLFGLVVYTAAFIAEIVRAGVLAVDRGQFEAAQALGLPRRRVIRLVVLPQALRVIVPPMTSQYLNLTKNSSLAVAIGYPDLVSIANTAMSQTGQSIEGVAIIMLVYLSISLSISAFMNWYNRRVALKGMRT